MAPNKILLLSPSASPNAQSQKVSTKAALWWACSRRDAERLSGLPKVTQLASAIQSIKTTRSPWLTAGKTLSTSAWLHSCLSSQLHSQLRQERQSGHWWGWESTSLLGVLKAKIYYLGKVSCAKRLNCFGRHLLVGLRGLVGGSLKSSRRFLTYLLFPAPYLPLSPIILPLHMAVVKKQSVTWTSCVLMKKRWERTSLKSTTAN